MHENQQPQPEAFELSAAEREAIEHEKHHYEDPRAASVEALKIVPKPSVAGCRMVHDLRIADVLKPASGKRRSKVWRSCSQIFRQPVGAALIRYCDSVVCHINSCRYSGKLEEKS